MKEFWVGWKNRSLELSVNLLTAPRVQKEPIYTDRVTWSLFNMSTYNQWPQYTSNVKTYNHNMQMVCLYFCHGIPSLNMVNDKGILALGASSDVIDTKTMCVGCQCNISTYHHHSLTKLKKTNNNARLQMRCRIIKINMDLTLNVRWNKKQTSWNTSCHCGKYN